MRISVERVSNIPISRSGKAVFVINRCLEGAGGVKGTNGGARP
jgi:hypothetical protein